MISLRSFPMKAFRIRLLSWYRKEKRLLPWRKTRNPYKIWVSEIMLQQTQVATVIPYYRRWVKNLPTLRSLAGAPTGKVLRLWEGLGYYRRARFLHEAAKKVVRIHGGKIPQEASLLEKLPGIGRYTAGAIASIAFGEKTPVLDGNVIRVLTRIFGIRQSVDRAGTVMRLWSLAGKVLEKSFPGDFNQAMMELGATVCFPQNPECRVCPVRSLCKAHRIKKEMFFPVKTRREVYEDVTMFAAVLLQDSHEKVFLQKQPGGHWWAGLWTFPFYNSLQKLRELHGKNGIRLIGQIRHSVTRFRINLKIWQKTVPARNLNRARGGRWVNINNLGRIPLPAPHRKIARLINSLSESGR